MSGTCSSFCLIVNTESVGKHVSLTCWPINVLMMMVIVAGFGGDDSGTNDGAEPSVADISLDLVVLDSLITTNNSAIYSAL